MRAIFLSIGLTLVVCLLLITSTQLRPSKIAHFKKTKQPRTLAFEVISQEFNAGWNELKNVTISDSVIKKLNREHSVEIKKGEIETTIPYFHQQLTSFVPF